MEKIYNIGFLRLIFTIIVITFHTLLHKNTLYGVYPHVYAHAHAATARGYIAVEMFFIIAGFFLFFSAQKNIDFKDFALNKLVRLWCVPAFAIFCIWILSLFHWTTYHKYANILHLFMLKNTGMTLCLADNGTAWFVSVLFWVSLFYCYLIKNFKRKYVNLTIALITFFSFILLINGNAGHFNQHYKMVNSFFNIGMLRGLAEMGLGYFIALFYENYKPGVESKITFVLISALEIYLFGFIINNLLFRNINFTNDMIFIIFMSILFILFLLKKGILSKLTDNEFFYKLGTYTFSMYVMQEVVFRILYKNYCQCSGFIIAHPISALILYVMITCLFGIITYYIVEKPTAKIKRLLRSWGGGPALVASFSHLQQHSFCYL